MLAFLGGTLPAARAIRRGKHIAACSACADLVTWAAADIAATPAARREGGPAVRRRADAGLARRPLSDPRRRRARRHGRGLRRVPPGPRPPHRLEGRAASPARARASAARACCARRAPSPGCRTRTSSPSTTRARWATASSSRWSSSTGRPSTNGCARTPRTWQRDPRRLHRRRARARGGARRRHRPPRLQAPERHDRQGRRRARHGLRARAARARRCAPMRRGREDGAASSPSRRPITKTGALLGTPAYMSPEQFTARARSTRARTSSASASRCTRRCSAPTGANAESSPATRDPTPRRTCPAGSASRPARRCVDRDAAVRVDGRSCWRRSSAAEPGRQARLWSRRRCAVAPLSRRRLAARARRDRSPARCPRNASPPPGLRTTPAIPRRQAFTRAFLASGRAERRTELAAPVEPRSTNTSAPGARCTWRLRGDPRARRAVGRGPGPPHVVPRDNLDQVRALTDALATADARVVANAVSASKDLTPSRDAPTSRCCDRRCRCPATSGRCARCSACDARWRRWRRCRTCWITERSCGGRPSCGPESRPPATSRCSASS